jgi:leucine-rich repeat protein SHOC2
MSALSMLQSLQLTDCRKVEHLPEVLGSFLTLTSLTLSYMPMTSLPPCLAHLGNLVQLHIDSCGKLLSLPSGLASLSKLQRLTLESCPALKIFPAIVCRMTGLTALYCERSSFSSVPDALGDLTNLRVLSFDGGDLESWPASVGKLTKLQRLKPAAPWLATGSCAPCPAP